MNSARCHLAFLLFSVALSLSTTNAVTIDDILGLHQSKECKGDYDVVVLLDRSNKVGDDKSLRYIELIKKIVHLFDIKEDGNHFGLVLYNDDPQIEMKLNEDNDAEYIKNFLMTSLPATSGDRNVRRALRATRKELLTADMGDRPGVPNVCFILTCEFGVRNSQQFSKLREDCDQILVLRNGGYTDLEEIIDRVCPALTEEEALNKTIELCSPFCNNLTEPCNEKKESLCPLPYVPVDDCCFFITYSEQTWDEGLAECQRLNGSLIRIDSAEKTEKLLQYTDSLELSSVHRLIAIGLRDETGDNEDYHWISDGSPLTYSNWLNGEPSRTEETCTSLAPGAINGEEPGKWADHTCARVNPAVCETQQLEH